MALAQGLLCEQPAIGGAACGKCNSCTWLESAAHPDLRILSPATEGEVDSGADENSKKSKPSPWIGVEQVRELYDFIHVSSHRGMRKVIVINPAEALNANAANALLKNLEEPPARTHFILISHRPHRLPRTIISRCRQLSLVLPEASVALAWLREQGVTEPDAALAQSSGAPLLALAASEGGELAERRTLLRQFADPDFDPLVVAEMLRDLPLERFISWMQKWTHDIVSQRMLGNIRYNPDMARELALVARSVDPIAALRLHRKLVREQRHSHHPLNARLYFESVLLAYAAVVNPRR